MSSSVFETKYNSCLLLFEFKYTTLLEEYPTIFFANTWWISMKCTFMRQPWNLIWLNTSDYSINEVRFTVFWVQHVLSVWIQPKNQIVPPFSLQWISNESTKHYLIQMLLAINWCYWQVGKHSCMRMKVQGRLMQAHFIKIPQVAAKKKFGYFSNRIV